MVSPLAGPISENDLTVEHRDLDATQAWCVVQHGKVRAVDPSLGPMLDLARRIARAEGCAAWLVAGDEPQEITAIRDDST